MGADLEAMRPLRGSVERVRSDDAPQEVMACGQLLEQRSNALAPPGLLAGRIGRRVEAIGRETVGQDAEPDGLARERGEGVRLEDVVGSDERDDRRARRQKHFAVVEEVELARSACTARHRCTHLEDVIRQAEDDGRVETVVLDEEVHADGASGVAECPVDRALELLGHVVVEVAQEVDLAIELGCVVGQGVMRPRDSRLRSSGDVVKVSDGDQHTHYESRRTRDRARGSSWSSR